MLIGHRIEIEEALDDDFGVHPPLAADLIEVLGPAGRAGYAAEQLEGWLAAEPRPVDPPCSDPGGRTVAAPAQGRDRQHRPLEFPVRPLGRTTDEMLARATVS